MWRAFPGLHKDTATLRKSWEKERRDLVIRINNYTEGIPITIIRVSLLHMNTVQKIARGECNTSLRRCLGLKLCTVTIPMKKRPNRDNASTEGKHIQISEEILFFNNLAIKHLLIIAPRLPGYGVGHFSYFPMIPQFVGWNFINFSKIISQAGLSKK